MKKFLLLATSCILLIIIAGKGQSQLNDEYKDKTSGVLGLGDFENTTSPGIWKGTIAITSEFPSYGKSSIKQSSDDWQPLTLVSTEIIRTLSNFDCLKFDIYNHSTSLYFGSIQIIDDLATDEQVETNGQSYRGNGKIFINKGWNHYEFLLKTARFEEDNRPLTLNKICKINFSFGSPVPTIFIDNFRPIYGYTRDLSSAILSLKLMGEKEIISLQDFRTLNEISGNQIILRQFRKSYTESKNKNM